MYNMDTTSSPTDVEESTQTPAPIPAAEDPLPVDLDSYAGELTEAARTSLLRATNNPAAPPDIDDFPDALDGDGNPIFKEGDKIIIERRSGILAGHPYLDTKTYTVRRHDSATKTLWLWDESLMQHASDNYAAGRSHGNRYKLALHRSPGAKGPITISSNRKRGRPRKSPQAPTTTASPLPSTPPKKRGRPAGSKNRSRATIAAEKAEKASLRAAKRAAKKSPAKKQPKRAASPKTR